MITLFPFFKQKRPKTSKSAHPSLLGLTAFIHFPFKHIAPTTTLFISPSAASVIHCIDIGEECAKANVYQKTTLRQSYHICPSFD
uniref:Ovule protein n=1 Tax=Panagrellus redivivus TaxID=6233 RepID=A0A7E4VPH8_PANRE